MKNPEDEAHPNAQLEEARALIEGVRSRFRSESPRMLGAGHLDDDSELDRELRQYFELHEDPTASRESKLRGRIIDAVVDRLLAEWDAREPGKTSPLQEAVMERLIQRILERLL